MPFFRDTYRDDFCAYLRSLGIEAQMSERGRPEEKITSGVGTSLGIIDVPGGPIRWIGVKKYTTRTIEYGSSTSQVIEYGVPDSRMKDGFKRMKIKTIRMKSFPVMGKVFNLYWRGMDFGLGLTDRLNDDVSLNNPIMYKHDLGISAYPEHSC